MKLSLVGAVLAVSVQANSLGYASNTPDAIDTALVRRALPNAPNGYTPVSETCPSTRPVVRAAGALSQQETEWLSTRRPQAIQSLRTLLQKLNITGLDTNSYIDNHASNTSLLPNIGLAFSGGGYRAMLNGAGAIAAFDTRSRGNSSTSNTLAGLLQSSTYIAGLSGGSWLVGSLYINNFTSVQQIIDQNQNKSGSGSLWQLGNSILEGPSSGSIQLLSTANYLTTIYNQVQGKEDAGYNTTLTDYWGRALSYQLIAAAGGGPSYTFSSLALQDFITNGSTPLPFVVADGRNPGETIFSVNSTVFEFNPWEMGSWDPTTYAFAPLQYLGSNFTSGSLANSQGCVRGFDSAGFILGTSSSLFNQVLLEANASTSSDSLLGPALQGVFRSLGADNEDIADYVNPFYGVNNNTNRFANTEMLSLVDGGSDFQNLPLYPLIQPNRNVDVIFAVDSSADTNASSPAPNWPNGTSLVYTYQRQFAPIGNGTVFPSIPDQETFVNLGLNARPSFFGCDVANLTKPAPLVVYVPNAPYVFASNTSTFKLTYNDTERDAMIQNGFNVATMGNGTLDAMWPTCVGCAILNRSFNRTNTAVPDVCTQCFKKYCWDGTRNSTYTDYVPSFKLAKISVSPAPIISPRVMLVVGMAAGVALFFNI